LQLPSFLIALSILIAPLFSIAQIIVPFFLIVKQFSLYFFVDINLLPGYIMAVPGKTQKKRKEAQ